MASERFIRIYFAASNALDASVIDRGSGQAGLRLDANEARRFAHKLTALADELESDDTPDPTRLALDAAKAALEGIANESNLGMSVYLSGSEMTRDYVGKVARMKQAAAAALEQLTALEEGGAG